MKIHIKVNGKAVCGQKRKKNKLKFAENEGEATCARCAKAVSR